MKQRPPASLPAQGTTPLRRSVGLPLLVLYGTGVTVGAGIYVLIGEAAGRAGPYAPMSFLLAALVMAFTAGSFAELSGRVPQAAGEAVYADAAFHQRWLTLGVGLAVLIEAVIAAAAISLGSAGYLSALVALPVPVLVCAVVGAMMAVSLWGIRESVGIAGAMTVIEIAGLLIIVVAGLYRDPGMVTEIAGIVPPMSDSVAIAGILSASLIAFFAFIGFDDIVNLVEEAQDPQRTLPWAIGITLAVVTVLYALVSFVATRSVPLEDLAASSAPVTLLFERLTGLPPMAITLIAILATMNGVVIILIMGARVTYGLARKGQLPGRLAYVSPRTQVPVTATVLVAALVLGLALFAPLDRLAETSSQVMLVIFTIVNLALIRLKQTAPEVPEGATRVPMWVPVMGVVSCAALLIGAAWGGV